MLKRFRGISGQADFSVPAVLEEVGRWRNQFCSRSFRMLMQHVLGGSHVQQGQVLHYASFRAKVGIV